MEEPAAGLGPRIRSEPRPPSITASPWSCSKRPDICPSASMRISLLFHGHHGVGRCSVKRASAGNEALGCPES